MEFGLSQDFLSTDVLGVSAAFRSINRFSIEEKELSLTTRLETPVPQGVELIYRVALQRRALWHLRTR
jgi:hypothetical protein